MGSSQRNFSKVFLSFMNIHSHVIVQRTFSEHSLKIHLIQEHSFI